jgi:hypothetical protein
VCHRARKSEAENSIPAVERKFFKNKHLKVGTSARGAFRQTRTSSIRLLERPARVWTMPAEIKCLLCRREKALTCRDSVSYPRSREEVYHSRHMLQCYPGEQCTREGQKTPPGNSGRPHVPRGHNPLPSWERLHLFHRAVSNHDTAVHCSVGSFRGNCSPREPSLKSTHEQFAAKFLNQIAHEFGLKAPSAP